MARIIVVDDSVYVTRIIKLALESEGHEIVAIAHDGNEGIEVYKNHHPDLVLVDITMPKKGGRYCLEKILLFDPAARIIMVSAVSQKSIIIACLQLGALDFIEKPLKFSEKNYCKHFHAIIIHALNTNI